MRNIMTVIIATAWLILPAKAELVQEPVFFCYRAGSGYFLAPNECPANGMPVTFAEFNRGARNAMSKRPTHKYKDEQPTASAIYESSARRQ